MKATENDRSAGEISSSKPKAPSTAEEAERLRVESLRLQVALESPAVAFLVLFFAFLVLFGLTSRDLQVPVIFWSFFFALLFL